MWYAIYFNEFLILHVKQTIKHAIFRVYTHNKQQNHFSFFLFCEFGFYTQIIYC